MATAGNAIAFSGLTVLIALSTVLLVPSPHVMRGLEKVLHHWGALLHRRPWVAAGRWP